MGTRSCFIAGFAPNLAWALNEPKRRRTIGKARRLAEQHGVAIPEDVRILRARHGELHGTWDDIISGNAITARGPNVSARPDGYIYLSDHYTRNGIIPFLINPAILVSDEAILAVLAHEMFEFNLLLHDMNYSEYERLGMNDYYSQVRDDLPNNYHSQAWDHADELILKMRREKQV